MATIQFFGAARTVTGSKHLITTASGSTILLDCGLFQGINTDDMNQTFGFDPATVDYMVLSHAHIDHTGLIPRLVRQGFRGPIYTTASTIDLCEIMLMDSARIQERDLERVNERRDRRGEPLLEILYNEQDVQQALRQMQPVSYRQTFAVGPDATAMLTDAGHLLGSAAVSLTLHETGRDGNPKPIHLTFSGDIGRPNDQILRTFDTFPQADYILCESTYGDRLHDPEPDIKAHLVRIVQQTCLQNRGKLIIPAFAVDRTQELIYCLDQLWSEGRLPPVPVYIDSPMAVEATKVMRAHEEDFNPDILAYIKKDGDAFNFPNLHYISDVNDSKALNTRPEPCIIISPSGMAEAGRIKHHIKNNIENPANTILMVGYASPTSLAGALKRGDTHVTIFGERFEVRANIDTIDSLSAHGDYQEMLQFLSCQNPARVKKVFLVHGDYDVQLNWREKLIRAGFEHIEIPAFAGTYTLV